MEFVGLGTGHAVQLGVGDGNRAEAGQGGNQGFVFVSERIGETGVNQNRAVRARGAKGCRDENSRRRVFSKMRSAVDTHRNALAGGDRASGDLERRAQVALLETRADGKSELGSLGRHRLQLEHFLLLHEHEHRGRMEQDAEAVGDALHHGRRVRQAMQGGGDLDQNAGAAVLFAGKLVQTEGFEGGAELGRQNGDLGHGIVVKIGIELRPHKRNGPRHFSGNQQRRGHGGMGVAVGQPRVTGYVGMVEEEGATLVNRLQGDGSGSWMDPRRAGECHENHRRARHRLRRRCNLRRRNNSKSKRRWPGRKGE